MRAVAEPLWPMKLPVIGATGKKWSGKTWLGMSIAPGPETGVFDLEKSSASYEALGCHRWDVPDIMCEATKGRPWRPIEMFKWWRREVDGIKPGRFRVLMLDPASEIESGLCDYVMANPAEFGKTKDQYRKGNGVSSLYWNDVKECWKLIIAQITAKVETFYFTVHLRRVFEGNAPTSRFEPRGKETLMEMASLFLWLDRKDDAPFPSAKVLKSRLVHVSWPDGKLKAVPALPPRLPVATPDAIRQYMLTPPDPAKLKPEERPADAEVMTDDERLELRATIARDERERAQAELELATAGGGKAAVKATPAPPVSPEPVPEMAPDSPPGEGSTLQEALAAEVPVSEPAPESPPELAPADTVFDTYTGPVRDGQLIAISGLRKEWEALRPPTDRDQQWQVFLSKWNVTTARQMVAGQAARCIDNLREIVAELKAQHGTFRDN